MERKNNVSGGKWTPGEWVVDVQRDPQVWRYEIRTRKPHNPAGSIGKHVATLNPYLRGEGPEGGSCAEANARLIAAAPSLYDALQAVLDYYRDTGEIGCETEREARAALSQARGER